MQERLVQTLGREDPLEKEMATHSSILVWAQYSGVWLFCDSMNCSPQGYSVSSSRGWLLTPGFLPGESHGHRCPVGYSPWGHEESDTAEWPTGTQKRFYAGFSGHRSFQFFG